MKRIAVLTVLIITTFSVFAGDFGTGVQNDKSFVGRWKWVNVALGPDKLETGENASNYLLTFSEDGTLKIKADCRQGSGTWSTVSGVLTLNINSITKTNCEANSYADKMIQLLEVGSYKYKFNSTTQFDLIFAKGTGKAGFSKINDNL